MSAEKMGTLTYRTRLAFAVCSVIFLVVLAISPFKDYRREWKQSKRSSPGSSPYCPRVSFRLLAERAIKTTWRRHRSLDKGASSSRG